MDLTAVATELRRPLRRVPSLPLGNRVVRWLARAALRLMPGARVDGVAVATKVSPALRVYTPAERQSDAALLWIHGGGFVIGGAKQDDAFCAGTSRELGIMVVSVDYRLAPESPFPAPLDDCHATIRWMRDDSEALGIDPARIAVGGQSAGGGLAATLVQRLHDEGRGAVAQWLFSPMLDDRTAARHALDEPAHLIWNNRLNRIGWRAFLGAEPGSMLPDYAAAARRLDLTGLPPAWIGIGALDLFKDEEVDYARRLREAGVPVTSEIVPGAPHGFESWANGTELASAYVARARSWLRASLAG